MKIRTDYVSNSSSSSFVIVVPKEYEFKKFVKDVVRGTVAIKDEFFDEDRMNELKERNVRNLDYCLNTYELLFLGTFCYEYKRSTIKGGDEVSDFVKSIEFFKKNCPEMFCAKIVSQTEDELVADLPNTADWHAVSCDLMNGLIRQYQSPGDDDPTFHHSVVEAIAEYLSEHSRWGEERPGLFEVTMNTIYNTEALLAERKENIKLDKWCQNLDELKKLIKDGNRIFGIKANQGGDGESCTAIYSLGGWDADTFKFANVQVLCCEPG